MSAAQVQLAAHGQEDQWLTAAPNRTYFETNYIAPEDRSRKSVELPFDSQGTSFGTTGQCTIPPLGDYLTHLTLRVTLPPIYSIQPGNYVYPTTDVGGVYVQMPVTKIVTQGGTTLTANTNGNHYFSVGASVQISGNMYTITTIPTANSFVCTGVSVPTVVPPSTVTTLGIVTVPTVQYYTTQNSPQWLNNLTNKRWNITNPTNPNTLTTDSSSNFPVGSRIVSDTGTIYTVLGSTDRTFTVNNISSIFVAVGVNTTMYSSDGVTWNPPTTVNGNWTSVTYGNNKFVVVGVNKTMYSSDGVTWNPPTSITGSWTSVTYGKNLFVAVGNGTTMYSSDGVTWVPTSATEYWRCVTYGKNLFVAVGFNTTMYSSDGVTWNPPTIITGSWNSVTYEKNRFVAVGDNKTMYSSDGVTWNPPISVTGSWNSVTYGNNQFVAVANGKTVYSSDGVTWNPPTSTTGSLSSVTYGNNKFVAVGYYNTMYSSDGVTWNPPTSITGSWTSVTYGDVVVAIHNVSLSVPPLTTTFQSTTYSGITFANATDAAFWGFDYRQGPVFTFPTTPQLTYVQGGWIPGSLPPSNSTYNDSVAHQLCRAIRILVGKQVIKEYSGEYIELQNDLLVPYENKAILKLMNGTLDTTQSTFSRQYYVNIPLGMNEFPLSAMKHQNMSVEIDFEKYTSLSSQLNPGSGNFFDPASYVNTVANSTFCIKATLSYQHYILLLSYTGILTVYDTETNTYISYQAIAAFYFICVLGHTLYILTTNGYVLRGNIDQLINGNYTSFISNFYVPCVVNNVITIVADVRYIYYLTQDSTPNLYLTLYDTTQDFLQTSSYTTINITTSVDAAVTDAYGVIILGTDMFLMTKTIGTMYKYSFSQWTKLDYSSYGYLVRMGTVINNSIYFIIDSINILIYTNGVFAYVPLKPKIQLNTFLAVGDNKTLYSLDGVTWVPTSTTGNWYSVTYGNNKFVAVGVNTAMYSSDGVTWVPTSATGFWYSVTYGNNQFVAVGENTTMYSSDGVTWNPPTSITGSWNSVTYGNNKFVAVGFNTTMYSSDGFTWNPPTSVTGFWRGVTYEKNRFVAVGYGKTMYSSDGFTWNPPTSVTGAWNSVTYGKNLFVAVANGKTMYSSDGDTWVPTSVTGSWNSVTYGNNQFVAVGYGTTMYSSNGVTWVPTSTIGPWVSVVFAERGLNIGQIQTILPVGKYLYASTNSTIIQCDTTNSLAYQYLTNGPVQFDGSAPKIFATGPRYMYMFTSDPGLPATVHYTQYDPYTQNSEFQASIIADYESTEHPPENALVGIVQTQKVTDTTTMDIHGPVKELWITGSSSSPFQYANLSNKSTLTFAGEQMLTPDIGTNTYLGTIQAFETHTSTPIRNMSVLPFELNPESYTPNGTVNFSRIRDQVFAGQAQTIWVRNYNIISIQGGIGGLMFN